MGCCKSPFKADSSAPLRWRYECISDEIDHKQLPWQVSPLHLHPPTAPHPHMAAWMSASDVWLEKFLKGKQFLQISSWRQKYTHAFIRLLKKRVREGDANLLLLPCSAIMETQSHTPPKGHRPHEPRFSGCARQQSCNRTYLKLQTGRTSRTNLTENKNNTPIRSFKTCQNPKMSRLSFILFLQRKQLFYRQNF